MVLECVPGISTTVRITHISERGIVDTRGKMVRAHPISREKKTGCNLREKMGMDNEIGE